MVKLEDELELCPFEHWLTHDPHPEGNPLQLVWYGGKKQDPITALAPLPLLTSQLYREKANNNSYWVLIYKVDLSELRILIIVT